MKFKNISNSVCHILSSNLLQQPIFFSVHCWLWQYITNCYVFSAYFVSVWKSRFVGNQRRNTIPSILAPGRTDGRSLFLARLFARHFNRACIRYTTFSSTKVQAANAKSCGAVLSGEMLTQRNATKLLSIKKSHNENFRCQQFVHSMDSIILAFIY